MHNRFLRQSAFLLSLFMLISMFVGDAGAQSRRKRRTRRARVTKPVVRPVVTNPEIAPAGSEKPAAADSEKIISTADQSSETETTPEPPAAKKPKGSIKAADEGDMQQTIDALSNQVDRLNDKLSQMQETEKTRLDMERLTRAEQRSESLRSQQVDVEGKLADLQSKLELIEYSLRPENIAQAAGYGTVHPEEAREARRRQLESERARTRAQISILETSRIRLETAVHTSDAEVDALRRKIEMQQATQDTSGIAAPEPRQVRRPKPQ